MSDKLFVISKPYPENMKFKGLFLKPDSEREYNDWGRIMQKSHGTVIHGDVRTMGEGSYQFIERHSFHSDELVRMEDVSSVSALIGPNTSMERVSEIVAQATGRAPEKLPQTPTDDNNSMMFTLGQDVTGSSDSRVTLMETPGKGIYADLLAPEDYVSFRSFCIGQAETAISTATSIMQAMADNSRTLLYAEHISHAATPLLRSYQGLCSSLKTTVQEAGDYMALAASDITPERLSAFQNIGKYIMVFDEHQERNRNKSQTETKFHARQSN